MKFSELKKPLDPAVVTKGGQSAFGPKGDYIEGWHAIAEANRIFGFDGWSYTIDLTQNGLVEGTDSRGNAQWQAAYTCICTVTVTSAMNGPVIRQDVGFGSGFAKQAGDAIEGATKEAATDALKRALRTFGNPFGLALYDKSRVNVQSAPPPPISEDQRIELLALFESTSTAVKPYLDRAAKNAGVPVNDLRDLPATEFPALKAHLESKKPKGE